MRIRYIVLSIWLLFFSTTSLQAAPLKVATSEWTPYVGKEVPKQGLAIDIVKTALQRAGYESDVMIKNWSRTLEGVDIGVYDLIAAAWYTKERAQHFTFSKPYLYNEIKLLKRSDSAFQYEGPLDLQGKLVGVMKNYAYGEDFEKAPGVIKIPGTHELMNVLAVLNGQVDLTLDDERVLLYLIRHNIGKNSNELAILSKPVSRKGLHIAVSKQNPKHKQIVQAFDKAIQAMKKDGTFDRIVKSHAND